MKMNTIMWCLVCALGLMACGDEADQTHERSQLQTQVAQGLRVQAAPIDGGMESGQETLRFTFMDERGEEADVTALTVKPWMTHHGHGSSMTPVVTRRSEGIWEALVLFTMPGYWELQLQATYGGAVVPLTFGYEVQ